MDEYIDDINAAMRKYMADGVFETLTDSLLYIERQQSDGRIRHGLIGMVDLDAYDFTPGSGALIRATRVRCWIASRPAPASAATPPSSCPMSCCSLTTLTRPSSSR